MVGTDHCSGCSRIQYSALSKLKVRRRRNAVWADREKNERGRGPRDRTKATRNLFMHCGAPFKNGPTNKVKREGQNRNPDHRKVYATARHGAREQAAVECHGRFHIG